MWSSGKGAPLPANVQDMKDLADQQWKHLSQHYSRVLVTNIPKVIRCHNCGASHRESLPCAYCGTGE